MDDKLTTVPLKLQLASERTFSARCAKGAFYFEPAASTCLTATIHLVPSCSYGTVSFISLGHSFPDLRRQDTCYCSAAGTNVKNDHSFQNREGNRLASAYQPEQI